MEHAHRVLHGGSDTEQAIKNSLNQMSPLPTNSGRGLRQVSLPLLICSKEKTMLIDLVGCKDDKTIHTHKNLGGNHG